MYENKILLCKNVYKVPRATKMIRLVKEFMVKEKMWKNNKNKKCHKHVTNAPKGIGLAQDTFEER